MGVLNDQVAIVTGGAQGLGEALSWRLAREGADVIIADLQEDRASEVAQAITNETGRRALAVRVDITDEASVEAMVAAAKAEFGRVDLLVSNAGITISGPITEFAAETWMKVIEVNLFGYFLCAKHVCKLMKEQGSGNIIQINSKSGKESSYWNTAYTASKAGGIGMTRSLANEMVEHGVRVNAVCPGNLLDSPMWVNTLYTQYAKKWGITEAEVRQRYVEKVPMKRGCTYKDIANVVVFLASDASSYMTGQAINVTGGQVMH